MGVLKIAGNKNTPVPVPEGKWSLLSYTIDMPEAPKPGKPAKKESAKEELKDGSLAEALANTLKALLGDDGDHNLSRPRFSLVTAQATADFKPVKVVQGKTVVFPFGPPYKPVVTAPYYGSGQKQQIQLELSLVGSTGEICSDMIVKGSRPAKPEFTITDDKGKVVQQGSFEYG